MKDTVEAERKGHENGYHLGFERGALTERQRMLAVLEDIEASVSAMVKVDSDDVGSSLKRHEYRPYAKAVLQAIKARLEGV